MVFTRASYNNIIIYICVCYIYVHYNGKQLLLRIFKVSTCGKRKINDKIILVIREYSRKYDEFLDT